MSTNLFGCHPGPANALTDVSGLRLGHAQTPMSSAPGAGSGVTTVVAPTGAVASVDVRGGGPGTRETDLLHPHNTVQRIHAVTLSGGSAYGLAAASGAMNELESRGIGFQVLGPQDPGKIVPIVPAAVIFDLPLAGWGARPGLAEGAAAVVDALDGGCSGGDATAHPQSVAAPLAGNIGAGTAASAGALKGGFGQASARFPQLEESPVAGYTVAAAMISNPQGAVFDPSAGLPWGLPAELHGEFSHYGLNDRDENGRVRPLERKVAEQMASLNLSGTKFPRPEESTTGLNTTIGVVATDAPLSKAQCQRLAMCAHDGLARAIRPAHMPFDGDTIFALSTATGETAGVNDVALTMLSAVAAQCVERAIVHSILGAESVGEVPSWRDVAGMGS